MEQALSAGKSRLVWSCLNWGRSVMLSFLGLGFVLGMQHAPEADHIAAVTVAIGLNSIIETMPA